MADVTLTKTRIRAGIWEGVLTAPSPVTLEVMLLGQPVEDVTITPIADRAGQFAVRVPIKAEHLSEGVQTYLIRDRKEGRTLTHFTIITGVAMEDDLQAEVDLLRQELDMLKRAFRRHCVETVG